MKLSSVLSDEKLIIKGEFCGNWFDIEYVDRHEFLAMNRMATVKKWKNHQQVEVLDDEKSALGLAEKLHGWDLKCKDLYKFFRIKPGSITDPEEDVDFTEDDRVDFIKNALGFDAWMIAFMMEIQNFKQLEEVENQKN